MERLKGDNNMSEVLTFAGRVFSELRAVVITVNSDTLTDVNMVKAMTLNEELKNLGYCLKPADIINLAKSTDLDYFYNQFKNLIGNVKAKPMYPNFPNQVMKMDEATFRFHQLIHYFTTYGIEALTGESVSKGWLPNVEDTEKTVDDTTLLSAKTIQLIIQSKSNPTAIYDYAYRTILSKRERMTDKEITIITDCIKYMSASAMAINIPFKQNGMIIFNAILDSDANKGAKFAVCKNICQHTGDVWKYMDYALTKHNYHFRTSQKRFIVKLLESYPIKDFKSNLIISNKKGKRTNLMLNYLDYNMYSRSDDHMNAVKEFRNGELRSWESRAKYLILNHSPEALDYVCAHPGTALRMLTLLYRNDYSAKNIHSAMKPHAGELSTQTLVSICNAFGKTDTEFSKESATIYALAEQLLEDKFRIIETPLMNKKVYIDMSDYNLTHSVLLTNDKSSEGGYIRSGIAYAIPETVSTMRFFTYWNDEHRVDIDLHANAVNSEGRETRIGWNNDRLNNGLVFSGDITHSDAAEYIDVDLNTTTAKYITFNIHSFTEQTFKNIDEVFVGCMAVSKLNEDVKLYNPKNCFFTHYLTSNNTVMNYGYLDIENRYIVFDGTATNNYSWYSFKDRYNQLLNLDRYINMLLSTQNVTIVTNPEEADINLIMAKPNTDKDISLIDNNFFMDY